MNDLEHKARVAVLDSCGPDYEVDTVINSDGSFAILVTKKNASNEDIIAALAALSGHYGGVQSDMAFTDEGVEFYYYDEEDEVAAVEVPWESLYENPCALIDGCEKAKKLDQKKKKGK